ncbi:MAG: hypothetical protein ACTSPB_21090 [Candidatus Thorarchaeota archaeon]
MSDPTYRIRFRKDDFEVEVQGDKDWVETKFRELMKIGTGEEIKPPTPPTSPGDLPVSLAEFIRQKGNPTEHSQLVVLFGYWCIHKKNMKSFNRRDIADCYQDILMPESANTSTYLNNTQRDGYFLRMPEDKDNITAWTITPSGEELVETMG